PNARPRRTPPPPHHAGGRRGPPPLASAAGHVVEEEAVMLEGKQVRLRAIERDDLPRLHELLDDDLELLGRAEDSPPRPISLAELEQRFDERLEEADRSVMPFG